MKIILLIIIVLVFVSCNPQNIAIYNDYISSPITFIVKNSNGDNLLDPGFEGNIIDNDIYIKYNGETYAAYDPFSPTRATDPPHWWGLVYHILFDGYWRLTFGDFTTIRGDFQDETFTIYWGDGTSDEVAFDLYFTREGNDKKRKPTVHKKIWLNGELESDNSLVVEIVK